MLEWTATDSQSPTWAKIKLHCQQLLDLERRRNDSSNYDATQTSSIRGRIATLKEMINLERTSTSGPSGIND